MTGTEPRDDGMFYLLERIDAARGGILPEEFLDTLWTLTVRVAILARRVDEMRNRLDMQPRDGE